jgi:hypothetical protein
MRLRFIRVWSAVIVAAVALAACEDRPAKLRTPAPEDEEAVLPDAIPYSDAVGQPRAIILAPYNLPAYAPVMPGAMIEAAQSAAPSGGPGGLVTFTTRGAPGATAEFYRGRLRAEFGVVSDAESARVRLLTAARQGTEERIEISIAPAAESGSRVTIAYVLPW